MKRIHFITGIILSIFVGFHLINHLVSLWGASTHIEWMNFFRKIYRHPVIETIVFAAVICQIFSGIAQLKKNKKLEKKLFPLLQIYAGLYLAFFLLIHVSAVIIARYYFQIDTNFYFGAAGLNLFPFNLFFIPYYSLAIWAFFAHLAAVHAIKMPYKVFGITPYQQSVVLLIIGLGGTLLILLGMTNFFQGIQLPETYRQLFG